MVVSQLLTCLVISFADKVAKNGRHPQEDAELER